MTTKELYEHLCHDTLTNPDIVTLCQIVMNQEQELEDIRNWIRHPRDIRYTTKQALP